MRVRELDVRLLNAVVLLMVGCATTDSSSEAPAPAPDGPAITAEAPEAPAAPPPRQLTAEEITSSPTSADSSFAFQSAFGEKPSDEAGYLNYPSSVAVDPRNGEVYVMSLWGNQVHRFTAAGEPLNAWTVKGLGVAVDPRDGSVFVAGHKTADDVKKFTPEGVLLLTIGSTGDGDGQFTYPKDVSIDPKTGNIYVVDEAQQRVQVFNEQGAYLFKFSVDLARPFGLVVSPDSKAVFVNSAGQTEIHKFAMDGTFIKKWGQWGNEPGSLRWPRALSADAQGNVYVADTDNERIQVFSPDGEFVRTFRGPHDLEMGTFHPRSVEVNTTTGEIYVTPAYSQRVDRFAPEGKYLSTFGKHNYGEYDFDNPKALAVDPKTGRIFVSDSGHHVIKRFNAEGEFETEFKLGVPDSLNHENPMWRVKSYYPFPSVIDMGADGSVWLLSQGNHYPDDPLPEQFIRRFSQDGELLEAIEGPSSLRSKMRGLAVHSDGSFFVTNSLDHIVYHLDHQGETLQTYGGEGSGPEQLNNPGPVDVDGERGVVYVVDVGNNRIQGYDIESGKIVVSWGVKGEGDGQFDLKAYSNLDVDSLGNVYLTDTGNRRIQVYSPKGEYITAFDSREGDDGPRRKPLDVQVLGDNIYVLGSNRVQIFGKE